MDLGDGLVAPELVLFVGEGLDRLRVGVGEGCGQLGRGGAHGNGDQARVADQLELGALQRVHEFAVGDCRGRVVSPILLDDLCHDLVRAPVGQARVEHFLVRRTVVRLNRLDQSAGVLRPAHIHRKLALRLKNRGGDTVHRKRRHEADQQENQHRYPSLRNDA